MTTPDNDAFISNLTRLQRRMYGYTLALLGNRDQSEEVLQEANLVLWRKAREFVPGTNFEAWAFRVIEFQVLAYRQKLARNRLVLDEDLVRTLADECAAAQDTDDRQAALDQCLQQMPQRSRDLLHRRYQQAQSVQSMAAQLRQPANTVAQVLHRLRTALLECIEKKSRTA